VVLIRKKRIHHRGAEDTEKSWRNQKNPRRPKDIRFVARNKGCTTEAQRTQRRAGGTRKIPADQKTSVSSLETRGCTTEAQRITETAERD
jgi:hypothetical protein